jgi:hypothetical protein
MWGNAPHSFVNLGRILSGRQPRPPRDAINQTPQRTWSDQCQCSTTPLVVTRNSEWWSVITTIVIVASIERKGDHSDCQKTTANRAAKTERPKTPKIVAPHSLAPNIAKFISTSCITYYKILPYLRNNSKAEQIPIARGNIETQKRIKRPK